MVVRIPPYLPRLGDRSADPANGRTDGLTEIQPPQRRRADEGDAERDDHRGVQPGCRRCHTRHHDALTERNDDEELKAFGEMTTVDLPFAHGCPAHARKPVPCHRSRKVESERSEPHRPTSPTVSERTGHPEGRRQDAPGEDLTKVPMEVPGR